MLPNDLFLIIIFHKSMYILTVTIYDDRSVYMYSTIRKVGDINEPVSLG